MLFLGISPGMCGPDEVFPGRPSLSPDIDQDGRLSRRGNPGAAQSATGRIFALWDLESPFQVIRGPVGDTLDEEAGIMLSNCRDDKLIMDMHSFKAIDVTRMPTAAAAAHQREQN
jgi:hypothetical protein